MDYLYLDIESVDSSKLHCPVSTAIALFISTYCEHHSWRVVLVNRRQSRKGSVVLDTAGLENIDWEILDNHRVPVYIQQCHLPALVTSHGLMIHCGLCCVLRQIVKASHHDRPESKLINLLGHKEICLKACAEVSVWTKFCEIEMPKLVESTLLTDRSTKDGLCPELPNEIIKIENHFRQTPIVRNVNKMKYQALKNWQQQNGIGNHGDTCPLTLYKSISSSSAADKDHVFNSYVNRAPELQHLYAEGTDFTLADLVLFPCISLFLIHWKEGLTSVASQLVRLLEWYGRIRNMIEVSLAMKKLGLPLVHSQDIPQLDQAQEIDINNMQSLNIRDTTKKKTKVSSTDVQRILQNLKASQIPVVYKDHPCKDSICLPWDQFPAAVHPIEGNLPKKRLDKKCQQLENLARAVQHLAREGEVIVDFCSGGGHLGILLAHLLPDCKVIMIENKEESITRALSRIQKLGLTNTCLYQCNLDYFQGHFDIAVCLHACGVATDLVLQCCLDNRASFVICPCCYGGIQNTHTVSYPSSQKFKDLSTSYQDYLILAHAADQTEFSLPNVQQGRTCMGYIDTDRAARATETGYDVTLCTLQPPTCSPKNDLLIGQPRTRIQTIT